MVRAREAGAVRVCARRDRASTWLSWVRTARSESKQVVFPDFSRLCNPLAIYHPGQSLNGTWPEGSLQLARAAGGRRDSTQQVYPET